MNRLAVFGNPIEHSLSPDIHAAFASQTEIELVYERILVPDGEFRATAQAFFDEGGRGCNVTVPCKRDAWEFVDEAGASAHIAQAVNTISRRSDGQFRGENTDGPGLVADLRENLGWKLHDSRILVLGAGGAVSGVLGSLLAEQPGVIHVYNRTQATAENLVNRFSEATRPGQLTALAKEDLGERYDVIINGTSAGLAGQKIDLPASVVGENSHCYDMVYGAKALEFLGWVQQGGALATSDGLGMLVEQAALAFGIWFDREVDTAPVIQELGQSVRKSLPI